MIHVSSSAYHAWYEKPFTGLTEAGFGSELEMHCLCGLVRGTINRVRSGRPQRRPRLFEIGTHRGAGLCHFHAMAPKLDLHSLNVLPSQLLVPARQLPEEILEADEIGILARERKIQYTQHLADSRRFDWDKLANEGRFDIVFIDGCHESLTVLADTLNALRILQPGGLLIWHDCKASDRPGRSVLAALHDLDAHEFAGSIRHIEGTWLAFAIVGAETGDTDAKTISRLEPAEQALLHLAIDRRAAFHEKVRDCPPNCEVLFFSNHRSPDWPDEATLGSVPDGYVVNRDPRRVTRADVVVFHLPDVPAWFRLPKQKHQIWIGITLEANGVFPGHEDPDKLATLDLLISAHHLSDAEPNFSRGFMCALASQIDKARRS